MKIKKNFSQFFRRVYEICVFLVFRGIIQRRFIPLSMSSSKKQRVYDRKGKKILVFNIEDSDEFAILSQIFFREDYNVERFHDIRIRKRYEEIVQDGRTPLILDLGGNVGLAAKYFDLMYPGSKIVVIEPSLDNMTRAKNEFSYPNFDFLQVAIGASSGYVELQDPGLGKNALRVEIVRNGSIEMLDVPTLMTRYLELYTPFICKIDIEGFEADLFAGESSWIDDFSMVVIELHDYLFQGEAKSRNFLKQVALFDRDFIQMGENTFSIKNSHK